ncbi:MAG TPA: FAD/NAD(P)-binding oxidoreductase [Candidatus Eisenbacteria bacterium]|nr:FAD/NAD(P)-binding oxidoreductase [Candidatus Eisenbacteria bacterium]
MTDPHPFDVLVIGGGPAGIAAATRAAECGSRTGIVDDNPNLGGQIWRNSTEKSPLTEAADWYARLQKAGVTVLSGARVFDRTEPGVLLAESDEDLLELRYRKLILATGAREQFLPFPGWTLPNVMGAGGLQAMVKSGLPIRGKRVVVAGTGPLLLAVASYLKDHGADVPIICEQASYGRLARFAIALWNQPTKISQSLQLKRTLSGATFAPGSWVTAAHGRAALESVTVSQVAKVQTIPCDYLACGFHLVPNIELAQLLGCQILDGFVQVDKLQQTSVANVFCAGEPTSIGGIELSLIEGQISGLAAADRVQDAHELFSVRKKAQRFARALDRAFQLRPELKKLAHADTLVCRCEDVTYSRLQSHTGWRSAKLHTRCGMGPCQGRICGPATQFLFDWKPDSVRPPVFPVRVESMATARTAAHPTDKGSE